MLFQSYPSLLSMAQLRVAHSTMVSCASEKEDDALAWYCVDKLIEAICAISPRAALHQDKQADKSTDQQPLSEILAGDNTSSYDKKPDTASPVQQTADNLIVEAPTRIEEATITDKLEAQALKSRRGHLLIVLIDQLSSVNLCWLEPLADRITWLLAEERHSDADARRAMIQILYRTLAGGMDMTKREAAAIWWLENGPNLEASEQALELQAML